MSTNITKQKRDALVSKINQIREFLNQSSDENASRLLGFLGELENDVTNKHYGLIFEEHRESIDEKLESSLPVLTEDKSLEIDNGGLQNFLIEGDNLASLKLLEKTHRGKIDVIYIDPPYNTGNKDFIYDDCFIDSTDTFRHSKWCSFMKKRLELARRLLSEKGVIFISIDDNEQAALKLLCDGIFGEGNFVGNVAWQKTYSPRNDSKGISKEVEWVLVYSKTNAWEPGKLPRTEKMNSKYTNPDNDDSPWTSSDAFAPSAATHQGMVYAIQHPFTGKMVYPYKGACWPLEQKKMLEQMQYWGKYELKDLKDSKERAAVCGISVSEIRQGVLGIVLSEPLEIAKQKAQEIYDKGKWPKFYFTNKGYGGFRRKTYLDETEGRVVTNLWNYEDCGHTDGATKTLKRIFDGEKPFDTPKPIELLEQILRIAQPQASALAGPNPRGNSQLSTVNSQFSTILDFFAGSGTTGHAVMKLNATDGGNRKFILCTNNQNNICRDITYERLKRVIEKENYSASLKYFRVDFVDINDKLYYEYADELLEHTRELVELENAINFNKNSKIAICLTEDELDSFCNNKKKIDTVKKIYLGHEVQTTGEQEDLFNSKQIEIVRIPNYYYSDVE